MKEMSADEKLQDALLSLGQSIARWTDGAERFDAPIPGLSLFKRYEPTEPMGGIYEPSICIIVQGAKRVLLGDDTYIYDAQHYDFRRASADDCGDYQCQQGYAVPRTAPEI